MSFNAFLRRERLLIPGKVKNTFLEIVSHPRDLNFLFEGVFLKSVIDVSSCSSGSIHFDSFYCDVELEHSQKRVSGNVLNGPIPASFSFIFVLLSLQ